MLELFKDASILRVWVKILIKYWFERKEKSTRLSQLTYKSVN